MHKYFGTDGVRGVANKELTSTMAYRIGRCLGQFPGGKKNRILVSRDTRASGEMLMAALKSGLLASGADVYDEGISTTPSVSYLVEAFHFDFGAMISASHNPFGDNGIKIFNGRGEKLDDPIEEAIERYMDRPQDDLPRPDGEAIGRDRFDPSLRESYLAWLASKAHGDFARLRVLADCANGSASHIAPELYRRLGLKCDFMDDKPDGFNINADCGSTHLGALRTAFAQGGYDFAFAFDGDADRFMALGPGGRLIDGDAMLYLNALSLRRKGQLRQNGVVMTVMSNFGLRRALKEQGIFYNVVPVGDRNVQAELKKGGYSLGGEQSGHIIFFDDLNTGDGLLSSIKLLNLFAGEKDIYEKINGLAVYPQILENVPFESRERLEKTAASDGLRAFAEKEEAKFGGNGRILVRMSGTEPLLRVMAEALDENLAKQAVADIIGYIKKEA